MRMKLSRQTTIRIRRRLTAKDSEGGTVITWGEPQEAIAEVWPASDQLQAQTYGDKIHSIMNVKIAGNYTIRHEGNHLIFVFPLFELGEGDGVCVYSDDAPDYQIVSATPYKPLRLEVKRI